MSIIERLALYCWPCLNLFAVGCDIYTRPLRCVCRSLAHSLLAPSFLAMIYSRLLPDHNSIERTSSRRVKSLDTYLPWSPHLTLCHSPLFTFLCANSATSHIVLRCWTRPPGVTSIDLRQTSRVQYPVNHDVFMLHGQSMVSLCFLVEISLDGLLCSCAFDYQSKQFTSRSNLAVISGNSSYNGTQILAQRACM